MKRCLHKLFTEALFVTARLEKTQITSGIWEGVHGIKGCSCKKEGEGQWLIKSVLLSGKSEWKKMCITRCYYLRHCVLTCWKYISTGRGQFNLCSHLVCEYPIVLSKTKVDRQESPSPHQETTAWWTQTFIEEKWRVWSNNSITKERC